MGPNGTPGVNPTASVIIYVLWYSCDTFTINKQLSPMSLCLAREGNFCAKLTWCPLAGRRLVSGSDLHLRPCILHFHLSHPANQQPGNWHTQKAQKSDNCESWRRQRVRDQFLHFSCFSLLTDGVVQLKTSPSNGKPLPSITTKPNSVHLSFLSWDHTCKKIL